MGLAGSPHCLSMCGAACTALCASPGGSSGTGLAPSRLTSFHVARLISYGLAGAVVASSVDVLARWGQTVALLRPLWLLVHLAAFGLGLYLLWQGRQPAWMAQWGRAAPQTASIPVTWVDGRMGGGRLTIAPPLRAGVAGLAWVAWPCGLLQSALVVAALADGAWGGASTMAAFAVGSSIGLLLGPALLLRLLKRTVDEARGMAWAIRFAGLGLALSSAWALGHGVWQQIAAYCQ